MLKFLLRWEFTCFLSGILLALSFSPTDLFYAPFVALALLFKALDQASWKQALFRGGFFGSVFSAWRSLGCLLVFIFMDMLILYWPSY
jgi:hypothetical protein